MPFDRIRLYTANKVFITGTVDLDFMDLDLQNPKSMAMRVSVSPWSRFPMSLTRICERFIALVIIPSYAHASRILDTLFGLIEYD
jgi:hypothetical protein